MERPELWIVAGPNGAGKTTLTRTEPISRLLPHVRFLNPDEFTLQKLHEHGFASFVHAPPEILLTLFVESANEVATTLDAALRNGEAVGVETVLSSDKYRPLVEFVREQNGFFGLIYVSLSSSELACARVLARVGQGGHDVPLNKIHDRWQRSLDRLPWYAERASEFWVFDNTDSNPDVPPQLVAHGKRGAIHELDERIFPELLQAMMELPRKSGFLRSPMDWAEDRHRYLLEPPRNSKN